MSSATYARLRQSWLGRNVAVVLTVAAFISAIATYVVITGSEAPLGIKPKRVLNLLIINITLLALLVTIIAVRIYSLWASLRAGSAGSRLQKRIVLMFSIVAILPTIIVSIFSALFFNLGIQTWFNDRVQTALGESLAVAEAYLVEHKENIRADAIAMASDLDRVASTALSNPNEFNRIVAAQSALRVLTESMVFRGNRIIAQGPFSFALAFERIPQDVLERAKKGDVVLMTDDEDEDKVRALVKLDALEDTYLLVGRLIDSKVLTHMANSQGAVSEYNNLKNQLGRLQFTFSVMFITLALLLLFSSIWYGMIFAARLTNPISKLVIAAERVRGGDFSARVTNTASKDEVGTLSRAFNRMTEQLEAQRGELIEANRRLDERRRFSEAVLSGVSAGVIALDKDKRITLSNRSASAILENIDQEISPNATVSEIFPGIQELLVQAEQLPGETTQATFTLDKNGKSITLHVRVTVEKFASEIEGFIVTFDDITPLVAAQRNAAWADVARRVAHEIKNPLTPIQLAAERLKRKYSKYIAEDQETFVRYTDTIVKHVGDIGKMVEEFVAFARMPTPKFSDENLSLILRKAIFSSQVSCPSIEYILSLPDSAVFIHCDERQITQVMTNLLKNAAEAIEARQAAEGTDTLKGKIIVTLDPRPDATELTIEDNGVGFPLADIQKMLDPYVTTRSKGTGLGLAIVKKIVEDHKGSISLSNNSYGGARVVLSFPPQCDIKASTEIG